MSSVFSPDFASRFNARTTSKRPSSRRLARVLSSIWNCGFHSEANTPGACGDSNDRSRR